jgi:hypothetical protein
LPTAAAPFARSTFFDALIDPVEGIIPGLLPQLAFHPLLGCCLLNPLLLRPCAYGRLPCFPIRFNSNLLRLFAHAWRGCGLATLDLPLLPRVAGHLVPLLPVPFNLGAY